VSARGEGWVALQAAAGATVVLVARVGPRPRGARRARRAAALGMGALGAAVGLAAARRLGPALTVFPRPRPGAPLTEGGPYRWVRHPMYAAVLTLACASATAGSPWALVPTAMLGVVLDRKAAREEAWLAEQRPEYAAYLASVRWRLAPGLR
jgi:protein-S-isoprenylcysteine O-methyltransferase Ste14